MARATKMPIWDNTKDPYRAGQLRPVETTKRLVGGQAGMLNT